MAVNVEYVIKLNDQLTRKLKVAQTQVDKLNNKVTKTKSSFAGLGGLLARVGAAAAIGMAAKSIVTLGANMEQTRVAFATFLGDAEKANVLIAQLNEFANITPFNNDEIIKSGRLLLAAGIPAEKITDTLKQIGDVAAGANVPITELAAIFQKATNKGKLQAEELNQFAERGIPILDELSKMFGKSKEEVLKLGSQGKITSAVMNTAFSNMTSEGGIFFNLMEKQSATLGGRFSTLIGKLQTVGIAIGEALIPVLGKIVNAFIAFVEFVKTNITNLKEVFAPLGALFEPLIKVFLDIKKQLSGVTGEGSKLEAVFNAIGNVLLFLKPIFVTFGNVIAEIFKIVSQVVILFVAWIEESKNFQKVLAGVLGGAIAMFKNFAAATVAIFKGVGNLLIGVFTLDIDKIKEGLGNVTEAFLKGNPIAAGFAAAKGFKGGFEKGFEGKNFFGKDEATAAGASSGSLTGKGKGDPTALGLGSAAAGGSAGALGAKVSEVKANAPKVFNINIEKLVEALNISTTNLKDSSTRIKEEVERALLTAITDASIISE